MTLDNNNALNNAIQSLSRAATGNSVISMPGEALSKLVAWLKELKHRRETEIRRINDLVQEVHQNAKEHGWWDEERSFGELIALCHSELSEALEEYREGKKPTENYYYPGTISNTSMLKPGGIPSELADTVIRIMDMCGHYGIDLEAAIIEKMAYNRTRPHKHGGKVI